MISRYSLSQVQLAKGSRIYNKMMKNTEYLLELEADRVLYHYHDYAGLDTKGAKSYGGWEGPWSAIRGEFLGHYMCACLNSYESLQQIDLNKSEEFKKRVLYIVDELALCQEAISKIQQDGYPKANGYVASLPTTQLDMVEKLEDLTGYDGGVPYYVHHKTFKGLVETYKTLKYEKALEVAKGFSLYLYGRLKDFDEAHMEKMLNSKRMPVQYFKEFGGMHEVLLDLYEMTQREEDLKVAKKFDRRSFREDLLNNDDKLAHHMQHANSEIPCVSGLGKHYELTGDDTYKQSVINFMDWMTEGHTFSTGGASGPSVYPDYGGEFYNYPNIFYGHVTLINPEKNKESGESCCAHNLNKISDQIFTWTGDAKIGDEYEKRFVNCVLPQQNDATGMFLYNLNLKQGALKGFGTRDDSFWCCYCSGIEAYSSLQNGAFYHEGNKIYANNFLACTLEDDELGLSIKEETHFPDESKINFTFELTEPKELVFNIRVPKWATGINKIMLNGEAIKEELKPSTYVSIGREFKSGDCVEVDFEFKLYTERMPDRPEYVAVKYGPNLLVGCTTPYNMFNGTEETLIKKLKPTGVPCEFELSMIKGRGVFQPLHRVRHELYNGYTLINQPVKEVIVDEIDLNNEEEMNAHDFKVKAKKPVFHEGVRGIGTYIGGEMNFTVTADSDEKLYVKCLYWGSEYGKFDNFTPTIRLFDVQIKNDQGEYENIATQLLDQILPNEWCPIIYPIPEKFTQGKKSIDLRIKAKDFGDVKGVVGTFYDKISIHHY